MALNTRKIILVVDDQQSLINIARQSLRRLGYDIVWVQDGSEAITMVEELEPNLIFMDFENQDSNSINMIDCYKKIREIDGLQTIPVVILLNENTAKLKSEYLTAGCNDFMIKPVRAHDLYLKVQNLTERFPRRSLRMSIRVSVTYKIIGNTQEYYEISNSLSESGLFVLTEKILPPDTLINISFKLPYRMNEIEAEGKVVYTVESENSSDRLPGMGIVFTNISEENSDKIHEYIERIITVEG